MRMESRKKRENFNWDRFKVSNIITKRKICIESEAYKGDRSRRKEEEEEEKEEVEEEGEVGKKKSKC